VTHACNCLKKSAAHIIYVCGGAVYLVTYSQMFMLLNTICAACRACTLLCLPRVQLELLSWSGSWRSRHWQTLSCSLGSTGLGL
jgi:hypothetical protein